jgi:hypothetical protein
MTAGACEALWAKSESVEYLLKVQLLGRML